MRVTNSQQTQSPAVMPPPLATSSAASCVVLQMEWSWHKCHLRASQVAPAAACTCTMLLRASKDTGASRQLFASAAESILTLPSASPLPVPILSRASLDAPEFSSILMAVHAKALGFQDVLVSSKLSLLLVPMYEHAGQTLKALSLELVKWCFHA
eukprot:137626-Hanusia_phi.AAC.1